MAPGNRPYLYAPTAEYSSIDLSNGFDPKAVSRASYMQQWQRPAQPKQDGPLININRHPDSYLVGTLPYGQTNVKPMHPATKKTVKATRSIQLLLRILQMVGALGMLVCVICIQNTQTTDSYIIRIPAAIDILATSYGIYHLFRAAASRTAASSASYHVFALVIDLGLIPFYIFVALLAKHELAVPKHDALRWKSFFNLSGTNKVILATWLDAAVLGGMHLVGAVISLFLAIVFRKISNMPPGMNPLEDNLTSRYKSKHKYKSSELSVSTISGPMTESSVSLYKSGRSSPVKDGAKSEVRPVSFLHTRNNSDYGYSPHNPVTASYSRGNVVNPTLPSVHTQDSVYAEERSAVIVSRNETSNHSAHEGYQEDDGDRTNTMLTSSSIYTIGSDDEDTHKSPPLPRKSSKRYSLLSDNWFVHRDDKTPAVATVDEEDDVEVSRPTTPTPTSAPSFKAGKNSRPYQPIRQHSGHHKDAAQPRTLAPAPLTKHESMLLAPLRMHPPTPPPGASGFRTSRTPDRHQPTPLRTTSGNVKAADDAANQTRGVPQHVNTKAPPSPSKARYYGDLGSAMAGIRSNSPAASPPRASPSSKGTAAPDSGPRSRSRSKSKSKGGGVFDVWRLVSGSGSGGGDPYAGIRKQDFAPGSVAEAARIQADALAEANHRRGGGGSVRGVVGSSGVDVQHQWAGDGARGYEDVHEGRNAVRADVVDAGLRGRNVSGKVAEEGRGGAEWISRWG